MSRNPAGMDEGLSTMIVSGRASREEHDRAISAMEDKGSVLEHCTKCNALLDVSECVPLTDTTCPGCGAMIKVLRDFHHFVLLSKLGQGGSGTVYRAFDETLERDVALKLLRNEHTRDPVYIDGLEREALITASINHPHVVKVFSTGQKNGFYYIAMEIVADGSLAQRIIRQGRQPEAAVLSIGIQLAEGLKAAYQHGLLHRDVKPGNILFCDRETLKVADFGLALPLEQTNDDSEDVWGTPDYIAPEKLLRQGEDVRSDIYSVGCTLFHCLAGTPPLDTAAVMQTVKNQAARPAPNIQTLVPEVSGGAAFVIARCLEINPAKRYQNYGELIEHLQYARDQGSSGKAALKMPAKSSAESEERKMALFSAVALVMIVAITAILLLARQKPTKDSSPRAAQTANARSISPVPAGLSSGAAAKPRPLTPRDAAKWISLDIGKVARPGSTEYDNKTGKLQLSSMSGDIWNREDSFRFFYQRVGGDFEISCHLTMVQGAEFPKTGIIFRRSLDPDSAMLFLRQAAWSEKTDAIIHSRLETGGEVFAKGDRKPNVLPCWLKLTRRGDVFTGAFSLDGGLWISFEPVSFSAPLEGVVGVVCTSRDMKTPTRAAYDEIVLRAAD